MKKNKISKGENSLLKKMLFKLVLVFILGFKFIFDTLSKLIISYIKLHWSHTHIKTSLPNTRFRRIH